jgi:hypothetical protein
MKTPILILAILSSPITWAQTALGPPSPAMSTPPSPALTPGHPALIGAGQPVTNLSVADVSAQLVDLQARIEQLLPVLASFNDNFDFISVGPAPPATPAANAGTLLGQNLSTSLAVNLGQNLSTLQGTTIGPPTSPANVPTPTGTSTGLPPGFGGPAATNGFATFPVTRDTLRELLILQFDIQRMLPLLNGLNSGSGVAGMFPETIHVDK